MPLNERLHHEADRRADLRDKMKRMQEEELMENYRSVSFHCPVVSFEPKHSTFRSFHPQIRVNPKFFDPTAYKPPHERVGDLQRERSEKLHRLRLEREYNNPDLTFSPKINEVPFFVKPFTISHTEYMNRFPPTYPATRALMTGRWLCTNVECVSKRRLNSR